MPLEQQFLLGVIIPTAVATLVMAVGVWRRRAWSGAIGVAAGYIAGHLLIRGVPPLPPIDVVDWLPFLVVLAVTAGLLSTSANVPNFAAWLIRVATAVVAVFLITRPMIVNVWSTGEAIAWLSALLITMAGIWSAVDATASRNPGPIAPFVLGLLTAALAVVQGLSSSLVLARLGGAAAITILPLAIVAWRRPREGLVRGALPVILVLFYGNLMAGFFYSEVSRGSALVLALSPLAAVLSRVETRRWIGVVLAVVLALACAGGAIGIAIATATPEPSADESY